MDIVSFNNQHIMSNWKKIKTHLIRDSDRDSSLDVAMFNSEDNLAFSARKLVT